LSGIFDLLTDVFFPSICFILLIVRYYYLFFVLFSQVLTGNSASAVEWLQTKFGLDLSQVSRLGGHSFPRTHRGKERFPGMTITYALMEKLEELAKKEPHRVRQLFKARVTKLLRDETSGHVIGIEYEKDGKTFQEYGPVVLATGGYAADFTPDSLLQKYRPDLYHLPTTNGDYSTGDGIKMGLSIGANAVDLEKVQVHPTGLVDPKEPDAKVKFLAAEALRGVGGLLLNANGERFCDELGHRDYVTGEMWKNKGPFRLVLNRFISFFLSLSLSLSRAIYLSIFVFFFSFYF
jgi:succinate dehydrogenase/fumarate reductase flavoprotein subunit